MTASLRATATADHYSRSSRVERISLDVLRGVDRIGNRVGKPGARDHPAALHRRLRHFHYLGDVGGGHAAEIAHLEQFHELFRSEEHTSELQSLMRISYAVFCLKKKITTKVKK